jgi:pimeloyl-ACP methyl ester carboxylesterase
MYALLKHLIAIIPYFIWKRLGKTRGKSNFFFTDGVKIYYEDHGAGEAVILLHGIAGFVESFYKITPKLSKSYRVIAMDSRGQGRSLDGGKEISYSAMSKDVIELLNHLGIRKANVVGWSDGGIIALHLAIHNRDRLRAIVAIAANSKVEGLTDYGLNFFQNVTPENWSFMSRWAYKNFAPHPENWPELIYKLKEMILTSPNYSYEDISSIKIPTLLVIGKKDHLVRVEHNSKIMELISGSELIVFKSATHHLPLECPNELVKIIDIFIHEHTARNISLSEIFWTKNTPS